MTGPCSGGGLGVAKAGFAQSQYIAPAAIGGALAGLSGWAGAAVGAAIGAITYDLSVLCPGGPPAMPTFTAFDINALLDPFFNTGFPTASQKFQDFLANVFWPLLCECSGGTNILPALATYPAGAPQIFPVQPIGPTVSQPFYPMLASQTKVLALGCGSPAVPDGWYLPSFDDSGWAQAVDGISNFFPSTWASKSGFLNGVVVGPNASLPGIVGALAPALHIAHNCEQWLLRWKVLMGDITPALARVMTENGTQADGGWTTGVCYVNGLGGVAVPTGALNWASVMAHLIPNQVNTIALWINSGNTSSANTWGTDGGVDIGVDFGAGTTPQNISPCCPPDQIAQAYLDRILTLVTLIQRQAAPFAYQLSTVHAGLSGAGSISVSGLIGLKVAITSDPTTLGVEGTSPPQLFDRGYVTFGTADGALHTTRLDKSAQLILPCDAGIYTLVYYDLTPGVTVSITELVKEP